MTCIRNLLFVFLSAYVTFNPLYSWATASFEEVCLSQLGTPELIVEVRKHEAPIEKVSSAQLQSLNSSALAAVHQAGGTNAVVHGTVESKLEINGSIIAKVLKDRASGVACARPGIKLELEYSHFKMLLSELLKEHSCEHLEVHAHESRHVDAFNHALDQAEEAVKAKWASDWSQRAPIFGSIEELNQRAAALRSEVATFTINHATQVAEQLNREIDTLSEYERMGNACNGALLKASH
jgi:hypothetical protein